MLLDGIQSGKLPMPSGNDTLLRQWLMLRLIPRYPRKAGAREITERLLAEGYSVSKRTVERDLQMLSEKFPLLSDDREKPYGWSWEKDAPNLDVPGMSPTEALTFMLAQEHLKPFFPAPMLGQLSPYFNQAAMTLSKAESLWALSHWTEKIAAVAPMQPLLSPKCNDAVVATIHEGVLQERQLQVRYRSRSIGAVTEYRLHPLALVVRGVITYLVATIDPYDDPRSFALHRFEAVVLEAGQRRVPTGFSLKNFIAEGAFGFEQSGEIKLVLRFDEAAAEHLKESPLSGDQTISAPEDGEVTVTATVIDTQQLRWWIMAFGEMVEVTSPASLRKEFARSALNLATMYQASEKN
jgi:predicted DNA-binding transcriptional regulator YafY